MPVSVEDFVGHLRRSGLLAERDLDRLLADFPPSSFADARGYASRLVQEKRLTAWQARALYQGRLSGLVFGNYVVLDKLGQGGMGVVFKAEHRRMARIVALKVLPPTFARDPDAVARFRREVQAAAQLSHPNIVAAYDADESHGVQFLAMEYIEGCNLRELVHRHGRLPIDLAIDYIMQAARGLAHAHERGVVHRDIKPSNLLLDSSGAIKVLDMGLARATKTSDSLGDLTQTGSLMGTVDYMSPEQAEDSRIADHRADVYSLGCTLFCLLTGRAPYEGASVMKRLLAHRGDPLPKLRGHRSDASEALEAVFEKMIAKRPDNRFLSMTAAISALEAVKSRAVAGPAAGESAFDSADLDEPTFGFVPSGAEAIPESAETVAEAAAGQTDAVRPKSTHGSAPVLPPLVLGSKSRRRRAPRRKTPIKKWILAGGSATVLCIALIVFATSGRGRDSPGDSTAGRDEGHSQSRVTASNDSQLTSSNAAPSAVSDDSDVRSASVVRSDVNAHEETARSPAAQATDGAGAIKVPVAVGSSPAARPPPASAPFDATQARAHQEVWADSLGVPVEYTNSIGMKFVLIPPGEFTMGSPAEEIDELVRLTTGDFSTDYHDWFRSAGPQRRVTLTRPWYVGACEVSQAEYEQVMGVNPAHYSEGGEGREVVRGVETARLPVENVSWYDAIDFCNALSRRLGLTPCYARQKDEVEFVAGTGYRLPTEAEWEYACRAGTETRYSFGDDDAHLGQYAWFNRSSNGRTHEVGSLASNPFGLFDVHGNVWEWCQDSHTRDHRPEALTDPSEPGGGWAKVRRGGSYRMQRQFSRSSTRTREGPDRRGLMLGFRVVLTVATESVPSRSTIAAPTGSSSGQDDSTDSDRPANTAPPPATAPFTVDEAAQHQRAWAKHLKRPVTTRNELGMTLVLMPPGEFEMGSTPEQLAVYRAEAVRRDIQWAINRLDNEEPRHRVRLTRPFYLSAHEVTQAQYADVMGENPSYISQGGDGRGLLAGRNSQRHPVENVSWYDAVAFCNRLSDREGRSAHYEVDGETVTILGGDGYRLPSEAEWEFAARAGSETSFWFGESLDLLKRYERLSESTVPAGLGVANPFGLYDMLGNVSEWVWDWYDRYPAESVEDPLGPTTTKSARVVRAGSWTSHSLYARSAWRHSASPETRDKTRGFRVARGVSPDVPDEAE